jgi:hypothetical protein
MLHPFLANYILYIHPFKIMYAFFNTGYRFTTVRIFVDPSLLVFLSFKQTISDIFFTKNTMELWDIIHCLSYLPTGYLSTVIDQYIQDTIQVFQTWHNLCSKLTSMWNFKILLHNTFPFATVFSFYIFTLLMFRKLYKPQLTKINIINVQNWRVCELLKCFLAIQKQRTNRPQVITNQTDHRWTFVTLERPWNI